MNTNKNHTAELIRPHSLAVTAEALRSGRLDLNDYVEGMCDRVAQVDPGVEAMLPWAACSQKLPNSVKSTRNLPIGRPFSAFWWPSRMSSTFPGL